jgi:NAD(P)-dependent dehydrogenase (short-subunit alcohol dehydrogenase family)
MIRLESKKNRVAIVTGSAVRLGKSIAVSLANLGFDIALHYNSSSLKELDDTMIKIERIGVKVMPFKADISNVDSIKKMFGKIKKEFKTIDVLVNNAAIFRHVDFFKISEKIFDEFINTNLKSTLFCSIEASKIMLKSSGKTGRIINIASLGGLLNWEGYIPYSLSKAGVIKLTQIMAKRLAPNILVNAIAPGTILIENDKNKTVDFREEKKYPMKRFAKSNDITSLIGYLVDKNEYITGHTFVVDGGRSLV